MAPAPSSVRYTVSHAVISPRVNLNWSARVMPPDASHPIIPPSINPQWNPPARDANRRARGVAPYIRAPFVPVGTIASASPQIISTGADSPADAPTAEGFVSAGANGTTARTRPSDAADRIDAPPPIECPDTANAPTSTRPKRNEPGSACRSSSHVRHRDRSDANLAWLGKKPPSDVLAIARNPHDARCSSVPRYCDTGVTNPCPNDTDGHAPPGAIGALSPRDTAGYTTSAVNELPSARVTVTTRRPASYGPGAE